MIAAMAVPMSFKALMTTFQTGSGFDGGGAWRGRGRWLKVIPERGNSLKDTKNNPYGLQRYVTYDTLAGVGILIRPL
jgi:hypothetical protein